MDWLAAIFSMGGAYVTGRKQWTGWLLTLAGSVLWAWIALDHSLWGMMLVNSIIASMSAVNAIRWRAANGVCNVRRDDAEHR